MKKTSQAYDDLLIRYIDGTLTASEKQDLERDLAGSDELRKKLDHMRGVHTLLRLNKIEHPSKNFTQLVMSKLNHGPVGAASFPIRNGIFLLAGVLLVAAIGAILVPAGVFDSITTTIDLNQVELPKKYIERTLPAFSVNGKLMVNLIILANLALGWLVLDRAILKPMFQRRIQSGH